MGDYTGLRFKARLTEKALVILLRATWRYADDPNTNFWKVVATLGIEIPEEFLSYERSGFIPFGSVCYMPGDWGENKRDFGDGQTWDVVCSAKDVGYHSKSMMELFCEKVLPLLIAEPCTAEVLYEHWKEPKKYRVCPVNDSVFKDPEVVTAILRQLVYSWTDIFFRWEFLGAEEKAAIPKDVHEKLLPLILAQRETDRKDSKEE